MKSEIPRFSPGIKLGPLGVYAQAIMCDDTEGSYVHRSALKQRDEELRERLDHRREQARDERFRKEPNFPMVEQFERETAVIAEFLGAIFEEADDAEG